MRAMRPHAIYTNRSMQVEKNEKAITTNNNSNIFKFGFLSNTDE